jgi:hypothetical protein
MKKLLLLFAILISITVQAQTYSGGNGTVGNEYLIANLTDLRYLSEHSTDWDKHFKQTANIDASATSTWNASEGFSPIGDLSTKFTGIYNGQGNTINGLFINRPTTNYIGLFGFTFGASTLISNVGLVNYNITGRDNVGGLIGTERYGTITNCYATGSVTGNSSLGGLIGSRTFGAISNCYATSSVTGNGTVGGLIGDNSYGPLTNCYAIGSVSGSYSKGGLIGTSFGASYTYCFWDTQTSGITTSAGGTGQTTAQMQTQSTFTGWDFANVWKMSSPCVNNNGYPILAWQAPFANGDGTAANPFEIATLNDLKTLSENTCLWNKHFKQTANIDASATSGWNSNAGFSPIGNNTVKFTGSYNGQSHTISGIFIYTSASNIGLFGRSTGTISNIGLVNCNISGLENVGALIGYNEGELKNSYATGSILGGGFVGGLFGISLSGSINNCYSRATVTGDFYVGGFAGAFGSTTLTNCYATGSVTGNSSVGGFVGSNVGGSTITKCFWDTQTSGRATSDGGEGKTTAEMQTQSTFTNWDFVGETANGTVDIWKMGQCTNNGYPVFATQTIPLPATPSAGNDFSVCAGSTISLTASNVASATYSWTGPNSFTSTTQNPSINNATAAMSGNYIITASAAGCTSLPDTVVVTVNALPTVNTIANQTICNGDTTMAVNFTGGSPGTVYTWTNNKPSIGLAASGTGDIPSFTTTNTADTAVVATVTVTPPSTSSTVGPIDQEQPNILTDMIGFYATGIAQSFVPTTNTICGAGLYLRPYSVGMSTSIISGDVTISLWSNLPNAGGTQLQTATVIGNSGSWVDVTWPSQVVTPGNTYYLVFSSSNPNLSIAGSTNNPYPNGQVLTEYTSFFPTHDFAFRTYTCATIGCTGTPTSYTYTVNPTPTAVSTPVTDTICSGANITTKVLSSAVAGTTFSWSRNNTTTVTGIAASGTGNISGILNNTTAAPVTVTFTITPSANGCTGAPITATVTVNPAPNAIATPATQTICSGANITTIALSSSVAGTTYNWTRDNTTVTGIAASGSGDISGTLTNTTTAPVTVTFTITPVVVGGCTVAATTATVTVNPTATVNTVASQTVCNGASSTAVNFGTTATGGTTTYAWTNNTTSIGLAASGTGNIPSFTVTNNGTAPVTATITVTPTYTTPVNNALMFNGNNHIAVTSAPTIPAGNSAYTIEAWVKPNSILGADGIVGWGNYGNTNEVNAFRFNGPTQLINYWWGSDLVVNIPNVLDGNWHHVVATFNGTTRSIYMDGVLRGSDAPTGHNVTITNNLTIAKTCPFCGVELLNGAMDEVRIWNVGRTQAQILATMNATIPVNTPGLAAYYRMDEETGATTMDNTGNGNNGTLISNPTWIVPSTSPATNLTACTGTPITYTYTVNPTVTVNAVANQVVCNAGATTAVNFGTTATGGIVVYNWTNNTPSIGLAASGIGNIASFNAVNTTTAPITATITVTPTFTNGAVSCVGNVRTFTITVNPTAIVNTVANQVVCNGSPVTAITFGTTATVGTTTYAWTNNTTSIGLAASGTGNIAAFNAVNTTAAPITATITVTPTFTNGAVSCVGSPKTFSITVNPTATVTAISNKVECNGSVVAAFTPASPNTGGTVTYAWANNNTAIGLTASGTGTIPSFTATNTGTAAITATITVTPTFTNGGVSCAGTASTYTITVNPTATVNAVANQTLCNGAATTAVNFSTTVTGGTVVYNWTNNTPSIGLAATGTGNIAAFNAVNTTAAPVTATITVTPTFTNGGVSCIGTPRTYTYTVNPSPTVSLAAFAAICKNAAPLTLTGGSPVSTTGIYLVNGVAQTVFNPANYAVGLHTIEYVYSNIYGCVNRATQTILVNPIHVVEITASPSTGGLPGAPVVVFATVSPAGNYSYAWSKDNALVPAPNASNITVQPNDAGNYKVAVTSATTGCVVVSGTAFTASAVVPQKLFVFPNPSTGVFNVAYNNGTTASTARTLQVFNSNGAKVFSQSYSVNVPFGNMKVDITNAARGLYFVVLTDSNGKVLATAKVDKQ